MGIVGQIVAALPQNWAEYFVAFGLIAAAYVGYTICKELHKVFNQFVLGRLFGPAVDLKKQGKWAVVTGATDGIGLAYAKQLAQRGIHIILISRSQEKLDKCARELEAKYKVETKTIVFNFTQPYEKYDKVKKGLAGLEIGILFNNVGMAMDILRLTEAPNCEKTMNDLIHINSLSAAEMTYIVLPGMMERRRGVIINNASFSAYVPLPFMNIYPATKAFVDFFSRSMTKECESFGIHVQSLMPHFVQTNLLPKKVPPTLFRPNADTFAKSAICTIGRSDRTFGYFPHHIISWISDLLGETMAFAMLRKGFKGARLDALEKLGITPQE